MLTNSRQPTIILDLLGTGNRLRISAWERPVTGVRSEFDVEIAVVGHPFSGVINDMVTSMDLHLFAGELRGLTVPGTATYGGNRGAELTIGVESQQGGSPGSHVVEVRAQVQGDDPWPRLTYLIFDQPAFWIEAAERIAVLCDR